MNVEEICGILGVQTPLGHGQELVERVIIDSRSVAQGCMFACLEGKNADGHEYAQAAEQNGAVAILAQKPVRVASIPVIYVPDVLHALDNLAGFWRKKFTGTVIAVTGTCGKTTVKDCLASVLEQHGKVACTEKNHNNQLGLALSILASAGDEKYWVLEAGISRPNDMEELGAIIQPDLAIILNAGLGHAEGLGAKGVAWHKSRLLNYLAPNGTALISRDYPALVAESEKIDCKKLYFSCLGKSPYCLTSSDAVTGEYCFRLDEALCKAQTPYYGVAGAENALAVAAAAHILGLDPEKITKGLKTPRQPEQRFTIKNSEGWLVLDDTYNANPLSMQRMLESAAMLARQRGLPFIAVLGEMGELGPECAKAHFELGRHLARLKPERIFWKGDSFEQVCAGFSQKGLSQKNITSIHQEGDFLERIQADDFPKQGVIIFKGSRSNKMEQFLAAFISLLQTRQDMNVL